MVGALSRMLHYCCQVAVYSALSRYLALNKCLIRAKSALLLQLMGFVDASGEQEFDCNFMLKNSRLKGMLCSNHKGTASFPPRCPGARTLGHQTVQVKQAAVLTAKMAQVVHYLGNMRQFLCVRKQNNNSRFCK